MFQSFSQSSNTYPTNSVTFIPPMSTVSHLHQKCTLRRYTFALHSLLQQNGKIVNKSHIVITPISQNVVIKINDDLLRWLVLSALCDSFFFSWAWWVSIQHFHQIFCALTSLLALWNKEAIYAAIYFGSSGLGLFICCWDTLKKRGTCKLYSRKTRIFSQRTIYYWWFGSLVCFWDYFWSWTYISEAVRYAGCWVSLKGREIH